MNFSRSVDLATALQAYAVKSKSDKTSNTNRMLQELKLRVGSFDNLFPAMFSLHGLDIRTAIDMAVKNKDITANAGAISIRAINTAMQEISNMYPVLDERTFKEIDLIVQEFIDTFNQGGSDTVDTTKLKNMNVHMQRLKEKFKQPYIVTYFAGDDTKVASLKIAHNSFKNLRTIINDKIKKAINSELAKNKITNSKLKDPTFLTTQIINWGHTQYSDSIITGKLLAELLSARNTLSKLSAPNSVVDIVVKDFLEQTGQEKTIIKVHHGDLTKGDPKVLSLVLESGIFQSAIIQNRRENQEDLGQLEKKWKFTDAIARKNLLGALGIGSIQELVTTLLKVKSSPSVLDNIGTVISNTIAGKGSKSTAKTIPLLNSTKAITKSRKQVKLTHKKGQPLKQQARVPISLLDLVSLQELINQHLTQQVKKNMGDGTRRDILNLRSGRFAESVKVERMSESRDGMITAFYTYMKYPYATFSEGGAQSSPRSRDPKLLIAKSIREIAATKVANRLRAVVV